MDLFSSQLVVTDPSKSPGTRSMGIINEMHTGDWVLYTKRRDGMAISLSLLHESADVHMREHGGDLSTLEEAFGNVFVPEVFEVGIDKAIGFIDMAAYVFSRGGLGVEATEAFLKEDEPSKSYKGYAHPTLRRTFDAGYLVNTRRDERTTVRPSVLRDKDGCAVAIFLYLN